MSETVKQSKLIQYLSEAYGKEKELETALEAHISITTRKPYRSGSRITSRKPRRTRASSSAGSRRSGAPGRSSPSGSPARRRGR